MTQSFFEQPILNSPYEQPTRHWVLDDSGQPTGIIAEHRRKAAFITPIPRPRRQRGRAQQATLGLGHEASELATDQQRYAHAEIINQLRQLLDQWRSEPILPNGR